MWVKWGLAMSSRSTMFWPSSESKGDLTLDSRISSRFFWAFKVPVTSFNCIRWSSDNAPRTMMLQQQFIAVKNQCRPFPFCNTATLSKFFQMSAYNTLRHFLYPCKVILFHTSVPNGNFTHTVLILICRFIQHTRFKVISWLISKGNSFLHINSWTVLCHKLPDHGQ